MDGRETQERVERLEALVERLETLEEPARSLALETVQGLLEVYGEGLRRIVELAPAPQALVEDDLVSHLLLLHDLHPTDVETRVRRALEDVRPYLGSHGGDVELLGVEEGVARLRLAGSCNGCPSSTVTLRNAIEEALWKAAPDLERIEAEGVAEPAPAPALVQIGSLQCPTELQSA